MRSLELSTLPAGKRQTERNQLVVERLNRPPQGFKGLESSVEPRLEHVSPGF